MRSEYDFSRSVENPYVRKPHSQVTMNLDDDVIRYFKGQAAGSGIPYQRLINFYLSQCVSEGKKLAERAFSGLSAHARGGGYGG